MNIPLAERVEYEEYTDMTSSTFKNDKYFALGRFFAGVAKATLVLGFSYSSIQAQTIQFEALQVKGGKKAEASCVILDAGGSLATIVELGADMKKASLVADGKKIPLKYVANDVNSRLAIYQLPDDAKKRAQSPATLGSSLALKPAEEVYFSSKDRADSARIVARVGRFQGKVLPVAVLRINHSKTPRLPGAGIYDKEGKLIGIVRQTLFGRTDSSYCLPVEVITRTRADEKLHGKVQHCWIGIVMDSMVAPPIVESVRPESPAQKAGLKKGDLILSIGEKSVANYSDVVDAFFYFIAGESKRFQVLRGTEVKEITVTPEASPRG